MIKVREAGNGLIRPAETPSEIRMHSHAGAWEREKNSCIIRSSRAGAFAPARLEFIKINTKLRGWLKKQIEQTTGVSDAIAKRILSKNKGNR